MSGTFTNKMQTWRLTSVCVVVCSVQSSIGSQSDQLSAVLKGLDLWQTKMLRRPCKETLLLLEPALFTTCGVTTSAVVLKCTSKQKPPRRPTCEFDPLESYHNAEWTSRRSRMHAGHNSTDMEGACQSVQPAIHHLLNEMESTNATQKNLTALPTSAPSTA